MDAKHHDRILEPRGDGRLARSGTDEIGAVFGSLEGTVQVEQVRLEILVRFGHAGREPTTARLRIGPRANGMISPLRGAS